MEGDVLVIALAVLGFGLLAGRLEGSPVTMPMVFTAVGLVLAPGALGVVDLDVSSEGVGVLAEVTLALVLFTDAARIDLGAVARHHRLAQRLLLVALPLAMLIGVGVGLVLFPDLPVAVVALLAATLAPTDAALGQAFMNNESVPGRIRQTLNVESGLNDGLALPFIIVLIDVARQQYDSVLGYVGLFATLVGLGTAVGVATGAVGGRLLARAAAGGLTTDSTQRLATVAIAAIAFTGSELVGGNGFVAAFTAGLAMGTTARSLMPGTAAFAETEGQLLALVTFLLFGTIIVVDVLDDVSWQVLAYALASLLVVRPAAVALSLLGTGVSGRTVAFVGWAGPRGLASIVYAVLVVESAGVPGREIIFSVAAWTILLSVYLHGLSAGPLSVRYGAAVGRAADRPEHRKIPEMPLRLPPRRGGADGGGDSGAARGRR